MRLSLLLALVFVLALVFLVGCSSAPSYEGGPTTDEPYAIIQPEDHLKMWAVDGKPAYNRLGVTYASPGNHTFKLRIDYPISDESQHPFEYKELAIMVEEGLRYRVFLRGEFEKGPPFELDQKVTKIRGYGQ